MKNPAASAEDGSLFAGETAYPSAYTAVVPNGGICPISGLKHAQLYQQLLRGEAARHVRTVILRTPGATRGKLLFHVGDMLRWLDGLAAQQASARRTERGSA